MSTLFVIDIDGTIAHAGSRFVEAGPEPSRNDYVVYQNWVKNVQNKKSLMADEAVPGMLGMIMGLIRHPHNHVVYLTSREEKWKSVTEDWLAIKAFPILPLIMRADDNYEEGADFKEKSIAFLKRLYNVDHVVVIDDDEHGGIEEKCHKHKWTFLKARSGGQK